MSKMHVSVGIGVLVFKDNCVLLGKRLNAHGADTWAPPGGSLEFGETFEQCAPRELREEAGIEVTNLRPGPVSNNVFQNDGKHFVTIMMLADYVSGEPKNLEPDKCAGWHWFEYDQLPQPLFLPFMRALESQCCS